jgi:hypothetical protein
MKTLMQTLELKVSAGNAIARRQSWLLPLPLTRLPGF